MDTTDHSQIVRDAAWLVDELATLKHMLRDVPYLDRPMGQESVLDMLARIGKAADLFFLPVFGSLGKATPDAGEVKSLEFETHLGKVRSTVDEPELLLDSLIKKRMDVLHILENLDKKDFERTIVFKEGKESISGLISLMVRYDRKQLKMIAERMLAMDMERHNAG